MSGQAPGPEPYWAGFRPQQYPRRPAGRSDPRMHAFAPLTRPPVFPLVSVRWRRPALFLLAATLGVIGGAADNPATTVNVDAPANRRPINPNIYGVNYAETADLVALNAPLNRQGGNATSRYNWQLDAHATG